MNPPRWARPLVKRRRELPHSIGDNVSAGECKGVVHAVVAASGDIVWLACALCDHTFTLYKTGKPPKYERPPLPGFPAWSARPTGGVLPAVDWEWDECSKCKAVRKGRYMTCEACGYVGK